MSTGKGESRPVADGTDGGLDDAKKGKPRHFLLVTKGTAVKYLQVSKKPIKPGAIAAAAKAGYRGDTSIGVIRGRGADLVFELATSDGYTKEPVKDLTLKSFLDEEVGFKCRPTIQLVEFLSPIPFDEDDAKNPVVARFLALDATIVALLDAKPELAAEVKQRVNAIRVMLQDELFTEGARALDDFETWLRGHAGAGAGPKSEAPTGAKPPTQDVGTLKTALAALKPEIDALAQVSGTVGESLRTGWQEAATFADAGDVSAGLARCTQLSEQLRKSWNQESRPLLQKLAGVFAQPFEQQSAEVGKLRAVAAFVQERAGAKRFGSALAALLKARPLIEAAEKGTAPREAAVIPEGIVAKMVDLFSQAKVRWDDGIRRAAAELGKIQSAIRSTDPELSAAMGDVLDGYRRELGDLLQAAVKLRDEPAARKRRDELLAHTRKLVAEFESDELIAHLDTFEGSPIKLRDTLVTALKQVDERLLAADA